MSKNSKSKNQAKRGSRKKKYNISVVNLATDYINRSPTVDDERNRSSVPFVYFGGNNLFPQDLIGLVDNSTLHGQIFSKTSYYVNGKPFFTNANGEKLEGNDLEKVIERWEELLSEGKSEEEDFDSFLWHLASDMTLGNGIALEATRTKKKKIIGAVKAFDWSMLRAEKKIDGIVKKYNFSTNWSRATRQPGNTSESWQIHTLEAFRFDDKKVNQGVIYRRRYRAGKMYYPSPVYLPALNAIEIDILVDGSDHNNLANGFSAESHLHVPTALADKALDELERRLTKKFKASKRGPKLFITSGEGTPAKIEAVPSLSSSKAIGTIASRATMKILSGWGIHPVLAGVFVATGMQSESTLIKETFELYQKSIVAPMQTPIVKTINKIMKHSEGFDGITFGIEPVPMNFTPSDEMILKTHTVDEIRARDGKPGIDGITAFQQNNIKEVP